MPCICMSLELSNSDYSLLARLLDEIAIGSEPERGDPAVH